MLIQSLETLEVSYKSTTIRTTKPLPFIDKKGAEALTFGPRIVQPIIGQRRSPRSPGLGEWRVPG
jgi:hypothetical protein